MKRVKRILAMIIMMAMFANCLTAITIKAEASESGTCGDNLSWELNDWGYLYIYGSGDMPDFSPEEPAPWSYCLPEDQLAVTIEGDVTSIGAYAFYGYTGALFVYTENSAVMSVGSYAFYDCQNLFEIRLPESIFTIGDYAFYNCCSLQEMPQLDLLTSIGNYAFYNCSNLNAFPLGSSLSTIGDYAFSETYCLGMMTFPATLTYIGDGAFSCSSIYSVSFEGPAPSINRWAFSSSTVDAYYDPNMDGWSDFPFADISGVSWYAIGGSESPLLGTGTCGDNLIWNLTQDGVMNISGTGRMTEFLGVDPPWLALADQITSVVIESGVEYIGREAFNGCTALSDVTVADSVQGIGIHAFDNTPWLNDQPDGLVYIGKVVYTYKGNCPAEVTLSEDTIGIAGMAFDSVQTLETINFPSSLREIGDWAFDDCINLKEIDLNEGLIRVGQVAFGGCDSLTEIIIPDSVTVMASGAFGSCASVERIVIGDGLTELSYSAFSYSESLKEIVFGSNLRSIGIGAFRGCTALEYVELPANITVIQDSAFRSCTALKSIKMPNVTQIAYYAFAGCNALEELELPETLLSIGECAFGYCSSLTNVSIPDSVTLMDLDCFESCTSLEEVYIGKGVSELGSTAFGDCTALKRIDVDPENAYYMNDEQGVLHTKDQRTLLTYPTGRVGAYTVADTVTKIDQYAFANCVGLSGVSLPEGLQTLEYAAFGGCTALTEIRLPDSLTKTYGGTFAGCTALETVWFGNGLERISATMFEDCTALKEVHLPETLEEIGSSAFERCESLTAIVLPDSLLRISNWAFQECKNLKDMVLPNNLQEIDVQAFYNCISLEELNIPDSVTYIGYGAFNSCRNLEAVCLSGNIKTINESLFYCCSSLESIVIPQSVQKIEKSAFAGCGNLEYVKYTGSQEQWEQITVGTDNAPLINATILFAFCPHDVVDNGICVDCGEEAIAIAVDCEDNVTGYYFSLADLEEASAPGQTITMLKDASEDADVVVGPDVVLDLNGHTLTADSILSYSSSSIVDTSEDASGLLKINDTDGNMISKDNTRLPVYDSENGGYRFFAINVEPCAVTGGNKYWFKIKVEKFAPFYDLINADADVQIKVKMIWDGQTVDTEAKADLSFTKAWADRYNANEDIYITVSVTESDSVENFKLIPIITSAGVEILGEEM